MKIKTKKYGTIEISITKEKYTDVGSYGKPGNGTVTELYVASYFGKFDDYCGTGDTKKKAIAELVWAIENDRHIIQL